MAHELARMLARSQVRASDEEREHAVRTLRHHFTSGRIAEAELEERASVARTRRRRAASWTRSSRTCRTTARGGTGGASAR